jgi:hypothetical protein
MNAQGSSIADATGIDDTPVVLLVDDQAIFEKTVRYMLRAERDIEVH